MAGCRVLYYLEMNKLQERSIFRLDLGKSEYFPITAGKNPTGAEPRILSSLNLTFLFENPLINYNNAEGKILDYF